MNIFELRNFLCEVENRRKAKLVEQDERRLANAPFDGHICDLPKGIKTYPDMYWRCIACKQYWHIKIVHNRDTWTMFGRLPEPIQPTEPTL